MEIPTFKFALREDLKENKEFLPFRATPLSSGWDCRCAQEDQRPVILRAGQYVKIPLGFRMIAPKGWWAEVKPRSSTFIKKSLHCLYGTIDNDFRGFMMFCATYLPDINSLGTDLILNFGEPIVQLIPIELKEMNVEEISNQNFDDFCKNENNLRGAGGFGSTTEKSIKK